VTLKNIFSKLADDNDFRGLTIFAETLEKSGEYNLSDKVMDYIKVANSKSIRLAGKYPTNLLFEDLKKEFIIAVNENLKTPKDFEDFATDSDIFQAIIKAKQRFYRIGKQILMHKYHMPPKSAKREIPKVYKRFWSEIKEKMPDFSDRQKFLMIAEDAFINNDLDLNVFDIFDPNSANFYYVFSKDSPIHKEIFTKAQEEMGPSFVSKITQMMKESKQPNYKNEALQGYSKYRTLQEKRNYGIKNTTELEILRDAIVKVGLNPNSIIDPTKDEFETYNTEETKNKVIEFILSKFNDLSNIKDSEGKVLHPNYFDDEQNKTEAERLYNSIIQIHEKNHEKYQEWLKEQEERKINNESEEEKQKQIRHEMGRQYSEELKKRRENIEQDLANKTPDKKWYQFWKKSYAEYAQYRFADNYGLNEIDEIAEKVKAMNPYHPAEHFELLAGKRNKIDPSLDALENIKNMGSFHRDYFDVHPQIYIYPSESLNRWRYLLFDPKHFQRMYNDQYHKKLSTDFSLDTPIDVVIESLHREYPHALIDYFESEEEMLSQE
jgi:hypothetical protein